MKAQALAIKAMADTMVEMQYCLQALISAISRQPAISESKLQQDFLELCETTFGGPDIVPRFAQMLAKTAIKHGPAKI